MKATGRNNVAVLLACAVIFSRMLDVVMTCFVHVVELLFVYLPPGLYTEDVGLVCEMCCIVFTVQLDFFYLFSVPVFDASVGASYLVWLLVAWLLPLLPLAVSGTLIFQCVSAAQGKNSSVIVSRLAVVAAVVFSVFLYPTVRYACCVCIVILRLLASSLSCTSYRGNGEVIGWSGVECSSWENITLVIYAVIVLPVLLFVAYMYKSLVFSRNPVRSGGVCCVCDELAEQVCLVCAHSTATSAYLCATDLGCCACATDDI